MKPMRIDFAPISLARTLSRVGAFTWTLASIALIVCLIFIVDGVRIWRRHVADQVALQQLIAQHRKRLAQIPVVQKKSITAAEISVVNTAIARLNLPWRDLLDAVERATPADIALLSLEPDTAKHSLKGSAEAKDFAAMIAYIASLQQQDFFSNIELLRHETNEPDTHKPIRFQFAMRWREKLP